MLSAKRLSAVLETISPQSFNGSMHRWVDLKSLFGIEKSASGLVPTRIPPEFLYSGGKRGRVNRYTPRNGPRSLYLADNEQTACAEAAGPGLEDLDPGAIFAVRVDLVSVLNLCDPAVLEALQTNPDELTAPVRALRTRRQPLTLRLARAVIKAGKFTSILFPSARRSDGVCLVVYRDLLFKREQIDLVDKIGLFRETIIGEREPPRVWADWPGA
jgi:hypothetical protein